MEGGAINSNHTMAMLRCSWKRHVRVILVLRCGACGRGALWLAVLATLKRMCNQQCFCSKGLFEDKNVQLKSTL